jgi:hypothetical protein
MACAGALGLHKRGTRAVLTSVGIPLPCVGSGPSMARLKNRSSEGLTFWRILETLTLLVWLPLSCSLVDISRRRDHRSILLRARSFSVEAARLNCVRDVCLIPPCFPYSLCAGSSRDKVATRAIDRQ